MKSLYFIPSVFHGSLFQSHDLQRHTCLTPTELGHNVHSHRFHLLIWWLLTNICGYILSCVHGVECMYRCHAELFEHFSTKAECKHFPLLLSKVCNQVKCKYCTPKTLCFNYNPRWGFASAEVSWHAYIFLRGPNSICVLASPPQSLLSYPITIWSPLR